MSEELAQFHLGGVGPGALGGEGLIPLNALGLVRRVELAPLIRDCRLPTCVACGDGRGDGVALRCGALRLDLFDSVGAELERAADSGVRRLAARRCAWLGAPRHVRRALS
jgi:hypothetical protein